MKIRHLKELGFLTKSAKFSRYYSLQGKPIQKSFLIKAWLMCVESVISMYGQLLSGVDDATELIVVDDDPTFLIIGRIKMITS
jgi:hypothetical protein